MTLIPTIPWLFFAIAAVSLGLVAKRAGRAWLPWALLGGTGSLVITTVTLGVGEAAFIPVSHSAWLNFCLKVVLIAILLNGVYGWIITTGIHGHHIILVRSLRSVSAKIRGGLRFVFGGHRVLTPGFRVATHKPVTPWQNVMTRRKTRAKATEAIRHESS